MLSAASHAELARTVPGVTGEVRFAVIGDVRGSFTTAAKAVRSAMAATGSQLDVVLCTGDMEANRSARDAAGVATGIGHRRWVGEFPQVLSGKITFAAPVFFVGGDHEPWASMDAHGPGQIAPGVTFLGRAGVKDVLGLTVAYLSGVQGNATPSGLCDRVGRDERACYVAAELLAMKSGIARRGGNIDLLLTHEAAAGTVSTSGDVSLRQLLWDVQPPVHLCGHGRERLSAMVGATRVEQVAPVGEAVGNFVLGVKRVDGTIDIVEPTATKRRR